MKKITIGAINRLISTIHYELQRISPYNAELAQLDADTKRKSYDCHSILIPDKQCSLLIRIKLVICPATKQFT